MKTKVVIKAKVKRKTDKLLIEKHTINFLPKEKFVRRGDKVISRDVVVLAEFDITIPFVITEETRETQRLAHCYFQTDDMYITNTWTEKVKTYREPELTTFVNECLSKFKDYGELEGNKA